MKSGLKIISKKVKVDTKNKVVICSLTCNLDIMYSNTFTVYPDAWFIDNGKQLDIEKNGTFTVIGKARCSEDDEFNEKLGTWIAEGRAKIKAYNKAIKALELIKNDIANGYGKINYLQGVIKLNSFKEENHINDLIK